MLPSLVPALGRVLGYAVSEGMAHISVRIRCLLPDDRAGYSDKDPVFKAVDRMNDWLSLLAGQQFKPAAPAPCLWPSHEPRSRRVTKHVYKLIDQFGIDLAQHRKCLPAQRCFLLFQITGLAG